MTATPAATAAAGGVAHGGLGIQRSQCHGPPAAVGMSPLTMPRYTTSQADAAPSGAGRGSPTAMA